MDRKRQLDESGPFHRVCVQEIPAWLDWRRLLGPGRWRMAAEASGRLGVEAELTGTAAADLEARLRGVGLGGRKLALAIEPKLPRLSVRSARATEARRYREGSPSFTRRGARLDAEARRSLTPEAIALSLGERSPSGHVLDAGCGAGGNAIGFARAGRRVTAIDRDPERLAMARHNAELYGVSDRIEFILGDVCDHVRSSAVDLLFVDPPWGASYDKTRVGLADLPLLAQLAPRFHAFPRVWLKLPPSFACDQLPDAHVEAVFGVGQGDERRVKFLLLELERGVR